MEEEQFEYKVPKLVYIYSMECDNIKKLKKRYGKNGLFLKHIPG